MRARALSHRPRPRRAGAVNPLCIDPIFKVLLQMATTTYLCYGDRRRALAKIEKEGGRTRTDVDADA